MGRCPLQRNEENPWSGYPNWPVEWTNLECRTFKRNDHPIMTIDGTIQALSGIQAVVFDVFGTIAEIQERTSPFENLVALAMEADPKLTKSEARRRIMSTAVGLEGGARLLGVTLPPILLKELERDLQTELASIRLFPDTVPCLSTLRARGYRIGLCSNLAQPYADPVLKLLDRSKAAPDSWAWSFDVGAVKPDPAIYADVCRSLHCAPTQTVMVGDSLQNDILGAQAQGIHGIHLARDPVHRQPGGPVSLADINRLLPTRS